MDQQWTVQDNERLLSEAARFNRDWIRISRSFGGRFSRHDCQIQYEFITQQPWEEEEEILLVRLHKIHYPMWATIAVKMGNMRTANICARKYEEIVNRV